MESRHTPEIRFAGFSGEWEERNFQDFTLLSQGLQIAIDKRHLVPGKNRMFYITNEFLNPNSDKRYYIESPSKSVIAKEEDILMTRTGNTGKVVTNVEGAFHNNFFRIAYNNKETAKLFLYYLLNSSPIQKEILVRAGTSTIPDLNHNDFYKIKVNTPQYEEQTQVGNFFKQLDDAIALHQQELTTLKQTKQGFLQKMFPKEGESIPEVRFPGFTGEWEERKVKDFSEETFGGGTPKTSIKEYWNGEIPWIQSSDLEEHQVSSIFAKKKITKKGLQNSATKLIPKNSIAIVTRVGVGKIALIQFEYATSQDFLSLSNLKVNEWFGVYSLYNQLQKELHNVQGTSIKGITKNELLEKKINIPTDLKEQIKIGNFFKKLDNTIALHQRELDALKETKKAFLQKMFV
ncbi:restriction endonuclease subunit S [Bacillus paralicheniformis]|uniref:restriction endonuclease subunit S n=1 Tax=Bacillus paralicheniformis TaxID=1648923 RepID=UPI002E1A4E67|nr:restriction endonuclease subunit S [Bacillus paralicheniformis]